MLLTTYMEINFKKCDHYCAQIYAIVKCLQLLKDDYDIDFIQVCVCPFFFFARLQRKKQRPTNK